LVNVDISILYVEDDVDTRSVFVPLLEKRAKCVYLANDGVEGFELFIKHKPDLIITDIKMPNENGMTFINKVKKVSPHQAIFAFTAYYNEPFVKDELSTLVNAILAKPLEIETLDTALAQLKLDINPIVQTSAPESQSESPISSVKGDLILKHTPGDLIIVGIGASAGGLEALTSLVQNLPERNNTAYIIAQHLSPTHKTMLVELLTRECKLRIIDAENGLTLQADTIYITPPNHNIEIDDSFTIQLSKIESHSFEPKPSINLLFSSIARYKKENAIGIILSGTGSDGSNGMRVINAEGGITIVQTPATAKYDSMPQSAINSTSIDLIVAPEMMGQELLSLANFPREKVIARHRELGPVAEIDTLFKLLKQISHIDFSLYKKSTICRRIERRMIALKIESIKEFVSILENDEQQLILLLKDLFIGVTSFFRDSDVFKALSEPLEQRLIEQAEDEEFRVWVAGCSSGEEAYSLLIKLLETCEQLSIDKVIRVFATDMDLEALKLARIGQYSKSSLSDIDPTLIKRYFIAKNSDTFEVKKELREKVIFSQHNLITDPPFSAIDLVSCRNLLIYFEQEAQKTVLPMLHYSLKHNGLLLLGKSENISSFEHLFLSIDKQHKIYKWLHNTRSHTPFSLPTKVKIEKNDGILATHKSLPERITEASRTILLPNLLVVNAQYDIIYQKGKLKFISLPDGYTTFNLFKVVPSSLALALRTVLNETKKTQKLAESSYIQVNVDTTIRNSTFIKASALPLHDSNQENYILYFHFVNSCDIPLLQDYVINEVTDTPTLIEQELHRTKEHLQSVVEELETSNEELQATNEELQSANEELQSTNEELETSNEELQSTNEELNSAYSELKAMSKRNELLNNETKALNDRYESVLENSNDAIVVCTDTGLFVRSNRVMEQLTGYDKNELMLKNWFELLATPDQPELINAFKNEFKNETKIGPIEIMIKTRFDTLVRLSIEFYATVDLSNQIMIWCFASDITMQYQYQQELAQSENIYKTTFNEANIGIAHVALSGKWLKVNKVLCNILGYQEQELLTKTFQDITHPDDLQRDEALVKELLEGDIDRYKLEKRYINKDGSIIWAWLSVARVKQVSGVEEVVYFIATIEDISDLKQLQQAQEQSHVIYHTTREGILVTDAKTLIVSANPALEVMSGYRESELIGKPANIFQSNMHTDKFYAEIWKSIKSSGEWSGEITNKRKNGELYSAFLNINSVKNNNGEIIQYVGAISDISQVKASQEKLQFIANHDALTGLPNRNLILERAEYTISKAKRQKTTFAVMFVDLDRFKVVNDGLGHSFGDKVLKKVAERLENVTRDEDAIARIGGDEFIVLLEEISSPIDAGKVAKHIIKTVAEPISVDNHNIQLGASIGISVYPNDGNTIEELVRQADVAMYEAKNGGRNTYRFSSAELSSDAIEKATMEAAIRHGLNNDEFTVYYQPIINLGKNRVSYVEALIRWSHPQLGLISPDRFIPLAEESDLITQISRFVICKVIDDLPVLKEQLTPTCKVSINFSAKDFDDETLLHFLLQKMRSKNLKYEDIIIELTESQFIPVKSSGRNRLWDYEKAGFSIAMDDFGTGFSNLSYLSKMPLDYLKIDKSFINQIGQDETAEEIIKSTIAIAKVMKIQVIAEGIETKNQLQFLNEFGCHKAQGYYYSQPKDLDTLLTANLADFE
jgi:two-component system CheB/CheR fusion protein